MRRTRYKRWQNIKWAKCEQNKRVLWPNMWESMVILGPIIHGRHGETLAHVQIVNLSEKIAKQQKCVPDELRVF